MAACLKGAEQIPELITGDNLIAFEIQYEPDPNDDGVGPDFHLVVYTLEGESNTEWKPRREINADQLATALNAHGFILTA